MKIIEKNEGNKIAYKQSGSTVSFANGELSLNCASYQRDWAVHLDICSNSDGNLVIGTATGMKYIAEIDIPAREYECPDAPAEEYDENSEQGMGHESAPPVAIPLDMKTVTLSLWAID